MKCLFYRLARIDFNNSPINKLGCVCHGSCVDPPCVNNICGVLSYHRQKDFDSFGKITSLIEIFPTGSMHKNHPRRQSNGRHRRPFKYTTEFHCMLICNVSVFLFFRGPPRESPPLMAAVHSQRERKRSSFWRIPVADHHFFSLAFYPIPCRLWVPPEQVILFRVEQTRILFHNAAHPEF